jgi:hypothetical protein
MKNMRLKNATILVLALVAASILYSIRLIPKKAPAESPLIPMTRLLARPDDFQGQRIRTVGFAIQRFEEHFLYLSREDAEHRIYPNALLLNLESAWPDYRSYSDKYVLVEGVFEVEAEGHLGIKQNGFSEVSYVGEWPARSTK